MQRAPIYLILGCQLVLAVPAGFPATNDGSRLGESSGARQGSPTAVKRINVNLATPEEIRHLPGVTAELVERIIRNRPYRRMDELVTKKVMGKKQFAELREYIAVGSERK
jgi:DNA uptake protein ComE-like DNA-binding protein